MRLERDGTGCRSALLIDGHELHQVRLVDFKVRVQGLIVCGRLHRLQAEKLRWCAGVHYFKTAAARYYHEMPRGKAVNRTRKSTLIKLFAAFIRLTQFAFQKTKKLAGNESSSALLEIVLIDGECKAGAA